MASMSSSRSSLLSLFCCVLCFYGYCHCISGTFYADNGRQQSVLYKTLGTNDKSELEKEILRLLGLPHRQRPRRHDTNSSAPRYLLDLYKALEEEDEAEETKLSREKKNIRKTLSDSDVVVSFVNKIPHHKSTNLRHETDRRFLFDVSDVPPEEEIVAAELRIYRDPELIKNKNLNGVYILDLYSLIDGENLLEPVDEFIISGHNTGWLAFNVTSAVMYWIAFPFRNNGLYLKIKAVGNSHSYNPHEIGLIGSKGPEDKQPFMVAYFKTTKLHVRKPRAAKKRHHDSYYDQHSSWNPYSNTYPSRRSCRRWTLYISFRDLGWQEWIIAPDGYGAYYCHGECSFPLNAHMNATNHAIVQTLVHLMDPAVVPKPCCAPTHTHAITVLYFDDNSNVILKKYKNMVVKSCGCH